jgi:transcriptional regulator with XRE-family HTH domain
MTQASELLRKASASYGILPMDFEVDTPEAKTIGDRIRRLRDAAGFDNASLARRMNLSEASIKAWMSGAGLANFVKLKRLAEVLGTCPNELLGFTSPHLAARDQSFDNLIAAVEGAFRHYGADPEEVDQLVALVQECASEPINPAAADPREIRRNLTEISLRRFLKSKDPQS